MQQSIPLDGSTATACPHSKCCKAWSTHQILERGDQRIRRSSQIGDNTGENLRIGCSP